MFRRFLVLWVLTLALFSLTSCHRNRVQNPLAGLDSKQPDKVLFDRAMSAMKKSKYEVSRTVLQTLINTYPDSEYIARAKLAVGDSWYAEGGTTGLAQAEIEYKDFITFFPNVPEAAEAQLKVANIHYRQMEKPDRDFTHARRAEEEYRNLVLQFPDSKLLPDAKQRLRQVQEVLAEREFRIGRFYYLRQSFPAAIARLKTLADSYPLFSQADEALYMLGSAYESEIEITRRAKGVNEVQKAKLIQEFTNHATEAYSQIVTRYPVMPRIDDAKRRLQALGQTVPTPTTEAIAQNRAEEQSRGETGKIGRVMGNFRRSPDVSQTAKVGEPNLTGTKDASAPEFVRQAQATMQGTSASQESNAVSVETVGKGAPPASQAVPKSGSADNAESGSTPAQETTSAPAETEQIAPSGQDKPPAETGIPELKPEPQQQGTPPATTPPTQVPPQANSVPAIPATNEVQLPQQVNDAGSAVPQGETGEAPQAGEQKKTDDQNSVADKKSSSSSKKKKKKAPQPPPAVDPK